MLMPNFIIIGTAKAGTTSLCNYLAQHPQIYMSPIKEPHFFSFEKKDLKFNGPGDREISKKFITNIQDYYGLFKNVSEEKAIGEASSTYLYISKAAERIHRVIPETRLIVILRNPVDRAYASYLHLVRDGRESTSDFAIALQLEKERIKNNWMPLWHYLNRGFYYSQLKRYFDLFDSTKIKIYLYEDFQKKNLAVVQDIFQFLEVDSTFTPNIVTKFNVSGIPKNRKLQKIFNTSGFYKTIVKKILPANLKQKIRVSNLSKPKLSDSIRVELKKIYREDILLVQSLIKKDLAIWL